MTAQRVAVKLFADPDPAVPVELSPFIALFHRFIQEGSVEGLLIDVADYAHVPNGPGIVLIGHDVDYAVDSTGGRTGLLVTRKRYANLSLADVVRDTLRKAFGAAVAIEADGSTGLRVSTRSLVIQLLDRLAAPNTDEAYEAAVKEVEPVLREVFGDADLEIARTDAGDPRKGLAVAVTVSAAGAVDAAALLARMGGAQRTAPVAASPGPESWEISAEDLKKLRDEAADFVLIDVREQEEYDAVNLGGTLIPLGSLGERMGELDKGAHLIVHCKVGPRGAQAVAALRGAGFGNAWNLEGGIFAWIDRIDPTLPKY